MDSVKKEGYLKIGNKTIDNLVNNKLINYKMRVYLLTIRMLNGWDKEYLEIPVSTYSNRLGIDKRYTKRLLKELKKENLINRNGSITSIPGDYIQWWWSGKDLPPPGSGKDFTKGGYKVTTKTVVKKSTLNTPTLQLNKPGGFMKKLSYKETEKLAGKRWLKQVLWQRWNFTENFIDRIFKIYSFTQCYDTLIAYEEANNVRDKEAWFLAKLQRGPETEE